MRARNDSLRAANAARRAAEQVTASGDSAGQTTLAATTPAVDSLTATADAALADSLRNAREIEVMRETFAYSGGTRDPFDSLINMAERGPGDRRPRAGRRLPEPAGAGEQRHRASGKGLRQAAQAAGG